MACPHGAGAPSSCSQCLGATARRVDLTDGVVAIDGAAVGTTREHELAAEETLLHLPSTRRGGRAPRRCSRCGGVGHTKRRCAS